MKSLATFAVAAVALINLVQAGDCIVGVEFQSTGDYLILIPVQCEAGYVTTFRATYQLPRPPFHGAVEKTLPLGQRSSLKVPRDATNISVAAFVEVGLGSTYIDHYSNVDPCDRLVYYTYGTIFDPVLRKKK